MTDAEILRACARRIRQGWCQRELRTLDGRVCAIGALQDCVPADVGGSGRLVRQLAITIGAVRNSAGSIIDWNDAEGQTQEAVARAFELTADDVERIALECLREAQLVQA